MALFSESDHKNSLLQPHCNRNSNHFHTCNCKIKLWKNRNCLRLPSYNIKPWNFVFVWAKAFRTRKLLTASWNGRWTNSWFPNNGKFIISRDSCRSWAGKNVILLMFKKKLLKHIKFHDYLSTQKLQKKISWAKLKLGFMLCVWFWEKLEKSWAFVSLKYFWNLFVISGKCYFIQITQLSAMTDSTLTS